MIRRAALTLLVVLALSGPALARPTPLDPMALADQAIATARKESFRSAKVDWPHLEAKVRAAAAGAKDEIDMLAVYALLLEGLGDGHSFVQVSDETRKAYHDRHGREFDADVPRHPQSSAFIMRQDRETRPLKITARREAALLTIPAGPARGPMPTASTARWRRRPRRPAAMCSTCGAISAAMSGRC